MCVLGTWRVEKRTYLMHWKWMHRKIGQVVENLLCKQEGLSLIPRNSPGAEMCTHNPSLETEASMRLGGQIGCRWGTPGLRPCLKHGEERFERHLMSISSLQVKSRYTQPRTKPNKGYERPLQWRCLRKNERQQKLMKIQDWKKGLDLPC